MDPYNFNPYAQQGLPMGRMGPQGMAPGGMPPGGPGGPMGGPMGGPGGPGPGMPPGGPGGPAQPAPQGVGGVQAGLQNGPQPTGPMPPPGPGDLSPEMIQQMIALRAGGGAIGQADKQQALADQLRNDARGRLDAKRIPSSTGGMVVGPTWGSAIGSIADQYRAHKLDEKATAARGKVDTDRAAASEALFNAMRKRGGAAPGA